MQTKIAKSRFGRNGVLIVDDEDKAPQVQMLHLQPTCLYFHLFHLVFISFLGHWIRAQEYEHSQA
jgi:hypothetical protein